MKSGTFFAAGVFLFCAAAFPAWTQEAGAITPPSWIAGTWVYGESFYGEEEAEVETTIRFAADDIFFGGDALSLSGLVAEGEVTAFSQKTEDSSYEIYIKYSDGYWYREVFKRPSAAGEMSSSYRTAEDESGEEVYTRRQL